jgi:long-chain acyl-CoA synthetase
MAAQALGGVPVPIYQDSIEREMEYIVEHSEARFAIVEDQEQVDKLLGVRARCRHLQHVVTTIRAACAPTASRGSRSLAELTEQGRKFEVSHPGHFDAELARAPPTTSRSSATPPEPPARPRAPYSHRNLIATARNAATFEGLGQDEEVLSYLPMAWVGDHVFSYAQAIVTGFTINCPESAATVLADLKEIAPTYFFGPPRIWRASSPGSWCESRTPHRPSALVHFFLRLAQDIERKRLGASRSALAARAVPAGKPARLRAAQGQSRLFARASRLHRGEAIGPEIFLFFRGLGVNVKQLYGMTEASVFVTIQRDGDVRLDTVGTPITDVEIRISDAGEVLFRSPGVFQGYAKNPEATRQTLEEGWIHSGDAGFLDRDGHLVIIDRAKDVSRLADGTMFAPKFIENKLKFSPYVREAVCIGQARPCVTAFINIDLAAVGSWAERRNIAYTSYGDLAQKPEVYELIRGEVERVNASLAEDDVLRGAQVRRFLILHKELDPDDEEITRTRKVRRGYIAQKYAALIDALYSESDVVHVEAKVKYEDGRTGTMRADVVIRDVGVPVPVAR